MHIEREQHRSPSPGLTPLIDVVFILLIFFMLATRFGDWHDLPIRVSEARDVAAEDIRIHELMVHPGGRLELDGEPVAPEALQHRLGTLRSREIRLRIRGADSASLQDILSTTDRVREAGIEDARLELLP